MKRILIFVLGIMLSQPAFAALTSGNITAHTHADAANGGNTLGEHTVTGTLSSTKACASGYVRTGPTLCYRTTSNASAVAGVRDACAAVASPSSGAKALIVVVSLLAKTANAIASRNVQISFYPDVACLDAAVLPGINPRVDAYEFSAIAAGLTLSRLHGTWVVSTGVAGSGFGFAMADDPGDQGTGSVSVVGYFD